MAILRQQVEVDGKTVIPCGLVANSLFTDTFHIVPSTGPCCVSNEFKNHAPHQQPWPRILIDALSFSFSLLLCIIEPSGTPSMINSSDIAWKSDVDYRFQNAENWNTSAAQQEFQFLGETYAGVGEPLASEVRTPLIHCPFTLYLCFLFAFAILLVVIVVVLVVLVVVQLRNDGVQSQHFNVWMRTAALSTFQNLWGRIDSTLTTGTTCVSKPHRLLRVFQVSNDICCCCCCCCC